MNRLAPPPVPADRDYAIFQRRLRALTGIDLSAYKGEQMRRRLANLISRHGLGSFTEYAAVLARDPARLQEFADYFTINVSEFFRDPPRWEELRRLLRERLTGRQRLKVWSAGCANGAEPYSLAILLADLTPALRHTIVATDIDRTVLERARRADDYQPVEMRHLQPAQVARYFVRAAAGAYAATDDLRARVTFRAHNLLDDPYECDCDLIVCRNVAIYFTDAAKASLYRRFSAALRPGGLLFVGGTEVILGAREAGLHSVGVALYARRMATD